ncbi:MAG: sulfur carrier protein ThiS adenylyltransferase ThiF [Deltaproteobacteria bacterium]
MNFESIKSVLKHKTVGIAGCGGLGSNCAVALARVGIGKLVIADFDIIEKSNLNRQYYFIDQIGKLKADTLKENIARINPEVVVEAHIVKLDESNIPFVFRNCDIIVEAFDRPEMKELILKSVSRFFPEIYLIMGIGMAGWGKNQLIEEKRYDKLIICGDELTEISENCLPLAPRVGIVANMQANAVLELLLG